MADSPVSQEVLDKLTQIDNERRQLGTQLLDLENTKIMILAAVRRLDEQRNSVFQELLKERGLSPDTNVSINPETRELTIIKPPSQ